MAAARVRGNDSPMGAVIRGLLALRGLTTTELVPVVGCSQPQISERMTGRVPFRAEELRRVAEFLGVPVSLFFETPDDLIDVLRMARFDEVRTSWGVPEDQDRLAIGDDLLVSDDLRGSLRIAG